MTELGTVPPPAASGSDEQALLQRLRDGEDAAFGELFELHAAAVRRLAQSLAADRSEAEDITAETFFRVLQALRRGSGPRDYVRAYLLTVARRVSWEWHGARRDVPVSDDELNFRAGAGADTHARTAEHTLITTAFTSLPERWRSVLWQTEVEGEQPAMVAPHFGLSANATAALARRARQGLRAAYLQAHLSVSRGPDSCRAVVEKLGGFTAGSVTGAEAERIKAHLLGCASCRATQDELRDVCSSLRAHAGVLVLLVPAATSLGGGGALSGLGLTLKSVLVGSKVKVGLALASTAAVGAVGVAAGPVLFGSQQVRDVGLSGGAPELVVVAPSPTPQQPPSPQQAPRIGVGILNGRGAVPVVHPQAGQQQQQQQQPLGANEVPTLPIDGVPATAGDGVTGGNTPRDDVPTSHPMTPGKATSPRLDTTAPAASESAMPTLDSTTAKPDDGVATGPADGATPTGRPQPPADPDGTTGTTGAGDGAPTGCPSSTASSVPPASGDPAEPTTTTPTPTSTSTESANPASTTGTADPATTVTPTSEQPAAGKSTGVTESGDPVRTTSASPAGS